MGFKIPYFHCDPCIKDSVIQEDMLMKKLQYYNNSNSDKIAEFSKKETLEKGKKMLITSNFSISRSVFKRLVLQTHKNKGLCGIQG